MTLTREERALVVESSVVLADERRPEPMFRQERLMLHRARLKKLRRLLRARQDWRDHLAARAAEQDHAVQQLAVAVDRTLRRISALAQEIPE